MTPEGASPNEPNQGFTVILSVASRLRVEAHSELDEPTKLNLNTQIPGAGRAPIHAELKVWTDEDHFIHRRIRIPSVNHGTPALYTLQLITKPSLESRDQPVFEAFIRSFSFEPLLP